MKIVSFKSLNIDHVLQINACFVRLSKSITFGSSFSCIACIHWKQSSSNSIKPDHCPFNVCKCCTSHIHAGTYAFQEWWVKRSCCYFLQSEQVGRGAVDIRKGGGRHQLPPGMAGQGGGQPGGGPANHGGHGHHPHAHRAAQGRPTARRWGIPRLVHVVWGWHKKAIESQTFLIEQSSQPQNLMYVM